MVEKSKKIVVALGGNAILKDDPTDRAQKAIVEETAEQLVALIKQGHQLIITHGNGPQVGNLLLQQSAAESSENPSLKLDTCVAMTEGSIGYWLQQGVINKLKKAGIEREVVCLITQVVVAEDDPAFASPTKPIGPFLSEDVALARQAETGDHYKEDAGRGWRKVVASPKPLSINEYPVIRRLTDQGVVTITAGGGGVPTVVKDGQLVGVEAVVDKDYASQKLASLIDADTLIILTGVDHVYVNYQKENQVTLGRVSAAEMSNYVAEGQFAKGSMLPKVEAAIEFVSEKPGREVIITSLEKLAQIDTGSVGTVIES